MDEMDEMDEVTQEYFHKVIHPLNVHYFSHKNYGEWKLNGNSLIAKTTPGYANAYVDGVLQPKRYFVAPAYSPAKREPDLTS